MEGFILERNVNYYETDMMGIVHHSNYIRFFEEARTAYMDEMGFSYRKMEDSGITSPVLEVHAEYKTMVRFGEIMCIYCKIKEFTGTRLTINYEIRDKETNVVRTVGESKHCFLNKENSRPVSLKRALPECFEAFNKELQSFNLYENT